MLLSGTFVRDLPQALLPRSHYWGAGEGHFGHFSSTLAQYSVAVHSSPFSLLPVSRGSFHSASTLTSVLIQLTLDRHSFMGKNETVGSQCFLQYSIYYCSKWLKLWPILSFWRVDLIGYSSIWQFSSLQLISSSWQSLLISMLHGSMRHCPEKSQNLESDKTGFKFILCYFLVFDSCYNRLSCVPRPLPNSYVKVLTPSTSECAHIRGYRL